jgi:hypothetical protein
MTPSPHWQAILLRENVMYGLDEYVVDKMSEWRITLGTPEMLKVMEKGCMAGM